MPHASRWRACMGCVAWALCSPSTLARPPLPPTFFAALCGAAAQEWAALGADRGPRHQGEPQPAMHMPPQLGMHMPQAPAHGAGHAHELPFMPSTSGQSINSHLPSCTHPMCVPLPQVDPGYAPYDEGTKADVWMKGVDGKPYLGWVSRPAELCWSGAAGRSSLMPLAALHMVPLCLVVPPTPCSLPCNLGLACTTPWPLPPHPCRCGRAPRISPTSSCPVPATTSRACCSSTASWCRGTASG